MPVKLLMIFSTVLITCPAFTLAEEVFTTEQRVGIEWRIQQAIEARLGSSQLLDDGLQDTVARGILRFIERQAAERIMTQAASDSTQAERASTVRPISNQTDQIYGSVTAPYSLIVYSDFNCGYCQRFRPTLQAFVEGSNGAVNWGYRHRPVLGTYLKAQTVKCAARLAGNTAFWSHSRCAHSTCACHPSPVTLARLVCCLQMCTCRCACHPSLGHPSLVTPA